MAKVLINATELQGTDVDRVSLVKRGANQIPFRIIKSEDNEMLDLSKVLGMFVKADTAPKGVAIAIVAKGADLERAKKVLKAAGLNVDTGEDKDGNTLFVQPGISQEGAQAVKITDEVVLMVSGIEKAFNSWDFASTSFGEVFKTGSFYPSLWVAQDLLRDTFYNIMSEAETPEAAATLLTKAVSEFGEYTRALASGLPVQAFKADIEFAKLAKEEISRNPTHGNNKIDPTTGKPSNGIEEDPAHGNETPHASGGKQPMTDIKGPVDNTHGSAIKTDAAVKTEEPAKEEAKKEEAVADPLAALTAALTAGLASIETKFNEQFSAVKAEMKTVSDTVATVKEQVAKTEEAVMGTVDAPSGDKRGERTQKSETRSAPPLLDTAFMKAE